MAISVGGDTDTNACIVMGMIGALLGYSNIPFDLLGNVLKFDCTKESIKWPNFLSIKHNAVPLLNHVIHNRARAGDKLEIENDHKVVRPPK